MGGLRASPDVVWDAHPLVCKLAALLDCGSAHELGLWFSHNARAIEDCGSVAAGARVSNLVRLDTRSLIRSERSVDTDINCADIGFEIDVDVAVSAGSASLARTTSRRAGGLAGAGRVQVPAGRAESSQHLKVSSPRNQVGPHAESPRAGGGARAQSPVRRRRTMASRQPAHNPLLAPAHGDGFEVKDGDFFSLMMLGEDEGVINAESMCSTPLARSGAHPLPEHAHAYRRSSMMSLADDVTLAPARATRRATSSTLASALSPRTTAAATTPEASGPTGPARDESRSEGDAPLPPTLHGGGAAAAGFATDDDAVAPDERTSATDDSEAGADLLSHDSELTGSYNEFEDGGRMPLSEDQARHVHNKRLLDSFDKVWTPVLFAYTLYQLVIIPLRVGLGMQSSAASIAVDLVLDLIYAVEIYLRFNRSYSLLGVDVYHKAQIAAHYKQTNFRWDVCACFPLDILGIAIVQGVGTAATEYGLLPPYFRLNKLMTGRYADAQFTTVFESVFRGSPMFARACRTFFMFWLACHFTGCAFLLLLRHEGADTTIEFTSIPEMAYGTDFQRYALLFDYALKALVGMGRPGRIIPYTDVQTGFSIAVALFGVCLYALMLATIGNVVSQQVSNEEEWRGRRDAIHDVLAYFEKTHTLPGAFREEVYAYFHHEFWTSRVMLGKPDDFFGTSLPPRIASRINAVVGGQVFARIPMFAAAVHDREFVNFMVSRLDARTYCRGETVMHKGEEGDFMFFLMQGNVGIVDDVTQQVAITIARGAALGDIALLQNCRRTATVVAMEFCSCFLFTRQSFLEAEKRFPEMIAVVRREGEKKLNKGILFNRIAMLEPYRGNADVVDVMMATKVEVYPSGTVIAAPGHRSDKMYFVSEGCVTRSGARLHAGDTFGEISCALKMREVSTVTSVGSVTLFTLAQADLDRLRGLCPALYADIHASAMRELRDFTAYRLFGKQTQLFLGTCDGAGGEGAAVADAGAASPTPGSAAAAGGTPEGRGVGVSVNGAPPGMPLPDATSPRALGILRPVKSAARIDRHNMKTVDDATKEAVQSGAADAAAAALLKAFPFFFRVAEVLREACYPAGTCVIAAGKRVRDAYIVANGTVIESYGDSVSFPHEQGSLFGARSVGGAYVSDTTVVVTRDCVLYVLSAEGLAALARDFPRNCEGFEQMRLSEIALVAFRKIYGTTSEGVLTRYFLTWLCYTRLQHCKRQYEFAGMRGHELALSIESHKLLAESSMACVTG